MTRRTPGNAHLDGPPPHVGGYGSWWILCLLLLLFAVPLRPAAAEPASAPRAAAPATYPVTNFVFEGSRRFSTNELLHAATNALLTPLPANVGEADLEAVRQALTRLYLDHGYLNSGAEIPDQDITGHVVRFRLIEGELGEIHVTGERHLDADWIRRRVRIGVGRPLNTNDLAEAVGHLREAGDLLAVGAELQPELRDGQPVPGRAVLDLRVAEAPPWSLAVHLDNYRPPSVGAEQLWLEGGYRHLVASGDALGVTYGVLQRSPSGGADFSGLDNVGVRYAIPVTPQDTMISASYDRRDYAVIEEPFQDLDIASAYWSAAVRIDQPLFRRDGRKLALSLTGERRHSEGSLLGAPFSFTPGSVNGESDVTALRLGIHWSRIGTRQSLVADLTTSVGVGALDATVGHGEPDGEFVTLLGRAGYGLALWSENPTATFGTGLLEVRGGFQWTPDRLLAMEQLSLGGVGTVRGYRENLLVRDTGLFGSIELPMPLWVRKSFSFSAGPFVDAAAGWNVDSPTPDPIGIASAGVGVSGTVGTRVRWRFDWGQPFLGTGSDTGDAQDYGLHFSVTLGVL